MDAQVTGSSPSFKIHRGSVESTQNGGTSRFGVAAIFARREPYLDLFRVVVGLREDNRHMGSGVIYYEIEKGEKYEDSDERAYADLAIVKTRTYHFDYEPFINPYELPIESLLALRHGDPSRGKDPSPRRSGPSRRASPTPQYSPLSPVSRLGSPPSLSKIIPLTQGLEGERPLKIWELIPPSEGWMCDGDEVEGKGVSGGIPARVDEAKGIGEEDKNEEEEEEEEEEKMSAAPRAMDVDTDEDYLQYLEELCRHPEYSRFHSSQAFAQNPFDDPRSPSSDARSQPRFDLSGISPPPVS
ncbi:hypothetical protein PIB30_080880 [Stylosanthes scabra]|uniref:Uncharacterized protein n=1 Tax=Stylosanthes scabra TaxID=79078 RepID=A0ABU6YS57_9FABA|nr:hypothetical protein [Stylosanthes scabra]